MQACASCAACAGASSRSLCARGTLAAAQVWHRPPTRWAELSTTAIARRNLPRCRCELAHTAHAPAHGIGADLLAQQQDGAAACATQQLECLPRTAYALARAALAAPFSLLILRFGQFSPLYRLHRTGTSRADAAVEARQLARSRFVLRAGCGRGMCD